MKLLVNIFKYLFDLLFKLVIGFEDFLGNVFLVVLIVL
jgi:hypothetical protein